MNSHLKLSEKGMDFLILKEGIVLKVYKDVARLDTVGIRHLITSEEKKTGVIYGINYTNGISRDQAIHIKNMDLVRFDNGIKNFTNVPLNQNEFDALISLSFNIGVGAFRNSTLLRLLNANSKRSDVANQILRWNRAGGRVIKGLTIRRQEERDIFMFNKYRV